MNFKIGDAVQLKEEYRKSRDPWFVRMMKCGNEGVITTIDKQMHNVRYNSREYSDAFYKYELELVENNMYLIDGKED